MYYISVILMLCMVQRTLDKTLISGIARDCLIRESVAM